MAGSRYRLQIIEVETGEVVKTWLPGHPIEIDLALELCNRLRSRGVGVFKSQEQVLAAVKEELASLIFSLKAQV